MRLNKKNLTKWPLILLVVIIVFLNFHDILRTNGVVYNFIYNKANISNKIENFQKIHNEIENRIEYQFDLAIYKLKKKTNENQIFDHLHNVTEKYEYNLLLYHNTRLVSWYGSNISNGRNILPQTLKYNFIKINNILYSATYTQYKTFTIVGLIPIKENYEYENEYLKNSFSSNFKSYDNFRIGPIGDKIFNNNSEYLFSLKVDKQIKRPKDLFFYILIFFQIALFYLIGYYSYIRLRNLYDSQKYSGLRVIIGSITTVFIYRLIILYSLKNSVIYKYNGGVESLVLLNIFFDLALIFFIFSILKHSLIANPLRIKNKHIRTSFAFLIFCIPVITMLYTFGVLEFFILKKELLISLKNIYNLPSNNLLIYTAILLDSIMFLGMYSFILEYFKTRHKNVFYTILIQLPVLLAAILFLLGNELSKLNILFVLLAVVQINFWVYKHKKKVLLKYLIVVFELALFFSFSLQNLTTTKHNIEKDYLVKALAVKNDPILENQLSALSKKIEKDSELKKLIANNIEESKLINYFQRKYFATIKNKYDIQVTFCFESEKLHLIDISKDVSCFDFFNNKKASNSLRVKSSNFWFTENLNGRVSYFGEFFYNINNLRYGIFIDLDSKPSNSGVGYPQLLKNTSSKLEKLLQKYNYAKYYKGVLVEQYGDHKFENYLNYYIKNENFSSKSFTINNIKYLAYKNGNYIVLISELESSFLSFLIKLSYIFVLVLTLLILVNYNNIQLRKAFNLDLQHKILFSLIGTLIAILLILVVIVISNLTEDIQFDQKQKFTKKILHASFFVKKELEYNAYSDDMNEKLVFLTNIIQSDINIYNANGDLVLTSRPEMVERGFLSTKINPEAYNNLIFKNKTTYIANEKIGKLKYVSTYSTLMNESNRINYIVNIPNFTSLSEYQIAISKIIGIGINSLIFITLVSILIILLIFRQILKPLQKINEELESIDFSSMSKINYKYDDEIGNLVKQYNKKITELKENSKLLNESERKNAWRSVSRQVAHEIKNPLTPMKLNIQFLQSAYNRGHENFEEIFNKTTKNLIEHIDTLSNIATSFSSFAKMPNLQMQNINIVETLDSSINMFDKDETVNIIRHFEDNEVSIVNTDPEQIQRCFTNILKNAIQSVVGKNAELNVYLMDDGDHIVIGIQDNGEGISEEQRDKIFTPNFTTKSSGMGIGLTIVKNIIDKSNGSIWFKSNIKQGTIFYIKLPLVKNKD